MSQSNNQWVNQPTNQPTNQSMSQPTNQPTNQSVNQPTNQPTNQSVNKSTKSVEAGSCDVVCTVQQSETKGFNILLQNNNKFSFQQEIYTRNQRIFH